MILSASAPKSIDFFLTLVLLRCYSIGRKRKRTVEANTNNDGDDAKVERYSPYTLFVHKSYDAIRQENPQLSERESITILARQWMSTSEEEKIHWKYQLDHVITSTILDPLLPSMGQMDLALAAVQQEEADGDKKRAAKTDGEKAPMTLRA